MVRVLRMTDLDLKGKRVLIREDLNVPLQDGAISDDTRIRASLPGIRHALSKGARLLLVSHLGRPTEGQFDEKESLAPVARRLSELLGQEVLPAVREMGKTLGLWSPFEANAPISIAYAKGPTPVAA